MIVSLDALFTTVAQISFGLIGLLVIAIAGDAESRQFWLYRESRAIFSFIAFTLIFVPGLFALGSLTFSSVNAEKITMIIPAWPFSAFLTGCLYWWFFRLASQNKQMKDYAEFVRLDGHLSIMNGVKYFSGLFLSLAIVGFLVYLSHNFIVQVSSEIAIGVLSVVAVFVGGLTAIQMFRHETKLKNLSNLTGPLGAENKNEASVAPTPPVSANNRFLQQLVIIALASISVVLSIFISKKLMAHRREVRPGLMKTIKTQ